jgi:hypothetical protein
MRQFFRVVSLVVGLGVFGDLAHAHHSQAGIFDSRKTIEVAGVVKSVSWRNPHGQILLAVRDDKGAETMEACCSSGNLSGEFLQQVKCRAGRRVMSNEMRVEPE